MSATPSEDARTTPKGFFCSRHSAIISLYRGSKMCSGRGTPGSSTSSSGKMGNSELTNPPVQTILRYKKFPVLSSQFSVLRKNQYCPVPTENRELGTGNWELACIDLRHSTRYKGRHGDGWESRGRDRSFHGNWGSDCQSFCRRRGQRGVAFARCRSRRGRSSSGWPH